MKSQRFITWIAIGVGLVALSVLVYEVGPRRLLDQLIAVAWAFPVVLLAEGLSNSTSTVGWYFAFAPAGRPPLGKLLKVSFASLAVAGTLPTGQASEVAKWNLLRGLTDSAEVVSSLVVFNYLHVLTTFAAVLVGPVVALGAVTWGTVTLPQDVVWGTLAVAAACFVVTAAVGRLLSRGLLHRLLGGLGKLRWLRRLGSPGMNTWAQQVDGSLLGAMGRRGDLWRAAFWLGLGRLFAIAEIWIILVALGGERSLTVALMVFSVTAVVNYVLLVLPAREGFLEASTFGVFTLLGMPGVAGLSLELTRRLRKIVYQVFGIGLLLALSRESAPPSVRGGEEGTPP